MTNYAAMAASFQSNDFRPAEFTHEDHLGVAFEILRQYDFVEATWIYARGVRGLAERLGAGDKFNVTITYAFMSIIAERLNRAEYGSFKDFIASNQDLLEKELLAGWYNPVELQSPLARTLYLMPKRAEG